MKFVEFVGVFKTKTTPLERSNVRRFLAWARTANDEQRADAACTLAWAYLHSSPPDELRCDLELCLTSIVDDPSPQVRRALAEALADANDAPRHVIIALADDQPEIASIVVERSPVLCDAELVDYAATGEDDLQHALARRAGLSACVAASLAGIAPREVAIAMIENLQARLPRAVARRIGERFSSDREVRQALLALRELPASLRYDLIEAAMEEQTSCAAGLGLAPGRIEKMTRAARERSVVRAAGLCEPEELRDLVRHLRGKGALTVALLMRALISGGRSFFESAAAELSGLGFEQVAAFVRHPRGSGFAALYRRMGLPAHFLSSFRAALLALQESGGENAGLALRSIASQVIAACESFASPELGGLLALLRRLEKEAAFDEARIVVERVMADPVAEQCEEAGGEARLDPAARLDFGERLKLVERLELMEATPFVLAEAS